MTIINTRIFGIMLRSVCLISTFMNKPLFIHTSEKLKFTWLYMPSLNLKHTHVKGQRLNYLIFKFQPNSSWAKQRPNRYTSFECKIYAKYLLHISLLPCYNLLLKYQFYQYIIYMIKVFSNLFLNCSFVCF